MAFKKKRTEGSHSKAAEQKRLAEQEKAEKRELRKANALLAKEQKLAEKEAKKAQREEYRNSPEAGKARFKLKLGLLIGLLVLVLVLFGISFAAYRVSTGENILPNIYVGDVFLGGMTREEAKAALEDAGWEEETSIALRVKLPAGVSFKLDPVSAGAVFSVDNAVRAAYYYGHSEGWYTNLMRYVKNLAAPVDVGEYYRSLNEDYILDKIDEGVRKFDAATGDTEYVVDSEKNELRFMKGAGEMEIDRDALYSEICTALLGKESLVDHSSIDNVLKMPDFQKVYDKLAVEPQDARYTDIFEVVDEVIGCTFEISEAEKLWTEAAPAEYVRIPLVISNPEVTGDELRARLFRDRLGIQTTLYTYSNANRRSNIALAASKLNGVILYPGQVFSFNDTVGQRTLEAGFKEAGAYADGQVVEEIGGGICQVSSTLYCASMYAQMETVSRTNHHFRIDYLPISYDAAVSWRTPDFKFKNSRDYPVKLVAYTDENARSLTIEIWGTDVDGSYVELSYWYSEVFDEEYTDVVIGEAAICYRHIYDANGNKIETIQEPYSLYYLHDEDIQWPESDDAWIDSILPDEGTNGNDSSVDDDSTAIIIPAA